MFEKSVLRVSDVCQIIGVSVPTLYRWQKIGHFPKAVKYGPGMVGWPRNVVEQWMEAKQNPQFIQEQ
ncbi:MAG TPA: AlpA family phage regulatory protein [Pseudomonadales bacterium]